MKGIRRKQREHQNKRCSLFIFDCKLFNNKSLRQNKIDSIFLVNMEIIVFWNIFIIEVKNETKEIYY